MFILIEVFTLFFYLLTRQSQIVTFFIIVVVFFSFLLILGLQTSYQLKKENNKLVKKGVPMQKMKNKLTKTLLTSTCTVIINGIH